MVGEDKPLSNGVVLSIHTEFEDDLGNVGLKFPLPPHTSLVPVSHNSNYLSTSN